MNNIYAFKRVVSDTGRYALDGIRFLRCENKSYMYYTNGHLMMWNEVDIPEKDLPVDMFIPIKTVKLVKKSSTVILGDKVISVDGMRSDLKEGKNKNVDKLVKDFITCDSKPLKELVGVNADYLHKISALSSSFQIIIRQSSVNESAYLIESSSGKRIGCVMALRVASDV